MKKCCFLIFVCLIMQAGYAQQMLNLVLYDVHSAQVIIPLSDKPILTFGNDSLNINTDNVVLQFPMNELTHFAYEQRENSTSVSSLSIEENFSIENNVLFLHTNPWGKALLYTISGIVTAEYSANSGGDISIPISNLSEGVYIIHYNGISFKFRK